MPSPPTFVGRSDSWQSRLSESKSVRFTILLWFCMAKIFMSSLIWGFILGLPRSEIFSGTFSYLIWKANWLVHTLMFWDRISAAAWARPDSRFSYPHVIPSNIHNTHSQGCIFITYSYLHSGNCSSYSGDNVRPRQHDLLWQFSPIVLSYNANIPN